MLQRLEEATCDQLGIRHQRVIVDRCAYRYTLREERADHLVARAGSNPGRQARDERVVFRESAGVRREFL